MKGICVLFGLIFLLASSVTLHAETNKIDGSVRSQESKSDTGRKKKTRLVRPVPELQYDSLTPVEIDEPRWPSSALINGQNGWVSLELQIDVEGIPEDVSVVDSSPSKLFDKTALKSIKKWRFELPENHSADHRYSFLMEFQVLDEGNNEIIDQEFNGDIEGLSNSTLKINHAEIELIDDERVSVSIDYELEPFHEGDRIYGCSFVYIDSENKPQTITFSPDEAYYLTKQADKTIISSPLPDDYELQLLKGKFTFYLMVLQRVDGSSFRKIGKTKYLYHKFSGFD